jgi:hypothetical protein
MIQVFRERGIQRRRPSDRPLRGFDRLPSRGVRKRRRYADPKTRVTKSEFPTLRDGTSIKGEDPERDILAGRGLLKKSPSR